MGSCGLALRPAGAPGLVVAFEGRFSMSSDGSEPALVIPEERRPLWRSWLLPASIAALVTFGAWGAGLKPSRLWSKTAPTIAILEVDRGDVGLVVTENG